ncbi:DotH/IcmK family type IV secretion protein [Stenotrophomonas maltophilia]|uniref:DotH/IcmK family type IV secretion protein n=1 Tax=Stenotrophomonas maltophilia TaxID=40324 RepID=UPI000B4D26D3|nr:DotH/IcmK family type IV secretion protein [Stenotrophomonas maltophilia]OWQ61260.1 hypothetical protein CEE58_15635 [Stenotrophomonas maltophilia]
MLSIRGAGAFAALIAVATASSNAAAQMPMPGAAAPKAVAPVAGTSQEPAAPAATAAPLPIPALPEVGKAAFERITDDAAPLSPEQIKQMARIIEATERAASEAPRFTPTAVSSAVVANLAPGASPPVVRLFQNYVTTVVLMDQLGNPLSIRAVDNGAPQSFSVTYTPGDDGVVNFFSISPKSMYAAGNVSVMLEGVATPVPIMLLAGQRQVDVRADVRVKGITSKTATQPSTSLPGDVEPEAMTMLAGMTPDGAQVLRSSAGAIQAWAKGSRFYVRTPADTTLLSPASITSARAPDGSSIYIIPPTPVLVVLAGRDTASVNLSGY